MSAIESLRTRLQDINRRSEAIRAAAEAMDRTLTDAERDKLDDLADEFDTVEADIRRMETIERQRQAAAAGPDASPSAGQAPEPHEPETRPQGNRAQRGGGVAVSPANVKRSESMLIALGVSMGVSALLVLLLFGDVLTLLVDGGVSLVTFLLGYKALKDGNIGTARKFSLTLAIVIFVLLTLQLLIALAADDAFLFVGGVFWALWTFSWLVGCGYLAVHQWLGPTAQQLRGPA